MGEVFPTGAGQVAAGSERGFASGGEGGGETVCVAPFVLGARPKRVLPHAGESQIEIGGGGGVQRRSGCAEGSGVGRDESKAGRREIHRAGRGKKKRDFSLRRPTRC